VDHDDCLRALPERVEERGVLLEVGRCLAAQLRVGRVQHRVLARMRREPQTEPCRLGAERRHLRRGLVELTAVVECRQVGVRAVGDRAAREPEDPHVDPVEVVERNVEQLHGPPQVRPRLPAARVVRPQPAAAEDLDREAEAVRRDAGGRGRGGGAGAGRGSTSSGVQVVSRHLQRQRPSTAGCSGHDFSGLRRRELVLHQHKLCSRRLGLRPCVEATQGSLQPRIPAAAGNG
jgi:hypothetical protein